MSSEQPPEQGVGKPFGLRDVLQRQKRQQRRPRRATRMRAEEHQLGGDAIAQRDARLARLRLRLLFLLRTGHDVGQLRADPFAGSPRNGASSSAKSATDVVALLALRVQARRRWRRPRPDRGRPSTATAAPARRPRWQLPARWTRFGRQERVLTRQHLVGQADASAHSSQRASRLSWRICSSGM